MSAGCGTGTAICMRYNVVNYTSWRTGSEREGRGGECGLSLSGAAGCTHSRYSTHELGELQGVLRRSVLGAARVSSEECVVSEVCGVLIRHSHTLLAAHTVRPLRRVPLPAPPNGRPCGEGEAGARWYYQLVQLSVHCRRKTACRAGHVTYVHDVIHAMLMGMRVAAGALRWRRLPRGASTVSYPVLSPIE